MSEYGDRLNEIKSLKCKGCKGLGVIDDSEPGDIFYREWTCRSCKGTGFEGGHTYKLVKVESNADTESSDIPG